MAADIMVFSCLIVAQEPVNVTFQVYTPLIFYLAQNILSLLLQQHAVCNSLASVGGVFSLIMILTISLSPNI